jgi:hypothetical protein
MDWRGVRTGSGPCLRLDVYFSPPRTISLRLIRWIEA